MTMHTHRLRELLTVATVAGPAACGDADLRADDHTVGTASGPMSATLTSRQVGHEAVLTAIDLRVW